MGLKEKIKRLFAKEKKAAAVVEPTVKYELRVKGDFVFLVNKITGETAKKMSLKLWTAAHIADEANKMGVFVENINIDGVDSKEYFKKIK